jgi:hypothetical protein
MRIAMQTDIPNVEKVYIEIGTVVNETNDTVASLLVFEMRGGEKLELPTKISGEVFKAVRSGLWKRTTRLDGVTPYVSTVWG